MLGMYVHPERRAIRKAAICAGASASAQRQEHASGARDTASKLALDVRRALKIGRKAEIAAAEAAAQVIMRQAMLSSCRHDACRPVQAILELSSLLWQSHTGSSCVLGSQQLQDLALSTMMRLCNLVFFSSPEFFGHCSLSASIAPCRQLKSKKQQRRQQT